MIPPAVSIRLRDRQKWAYAWMPQSRVAVDVGSSSGGLCFVAAARAGVVVALDINRMALEIVRQRSHPPLLLEASAAELPLKTSCADTVFLLDVIEHVRHEEKVIAEVKRILRENGVLILSAPHRGLFAFLDPQNLSARLRGTLTEASRHRHYSLGQLAAMLGADLRIERLHYGGLFIYPIAFALDNFFRKHFHIDWSGFFGMLCDLDNDASWGPFSYNILVLARRAGQ